MDVITARQEGEDEAAIEEYEEEELEEVKRQSSAVPYAGWVYVPARSPIGTVGNGASFFGGVFSFRFLRMVSLYL